MRVFARIGMYLELSDEEGLQLLKKVGTHPSNGESNEYDISPEFARRFIEHGELDEHDSYIPQGCITV